MVLLTDQARRNFYRACREEAMRAVEKHWPRKLWELDAWDECFGGIGQQPVDRWADDGGRVNG